MHITTHFTSHITASPRRLRASSKTHEAREGKEALREHILVREQSKTHEAREGKEALREHILVREQSKTHEAREGKEALKKRPTIEAKETYFQGR